MVTRQAVLIAALMALGAPSQVHAASDQCNENAANGDSFVSVELDCVGSGPADQGGPVGPIDPDLSQDSWVPACPADPSSSSGYDVSCSSTFGCAEGESPWRQLAFQFGEWTTVTTACRNTTTPTITPVAVATAFQRIPLPQLRSIAQPGNKTLVNFDTVFYVEAETLERNVTLLGQNVELTITPSRFRWTFGDGTSEVTTTPGSAYPGKSLTHRYPDADVTVRHQVEVTWTATWRVNNGPWQDVPGTVTITGPSTALRVAEATPLLAGGDD